MTNQPDSIKILSTTEIQKLIYLAILKSISDPICIIDRAYRLLWINKGKPLNNAIGQNCYRLFKGQENPCGDCPVTRVFQSGRPCFMEKWIPLKDEAMIWGEIRAYPIKDHASNVLYVIKIGYDLSDKQRDLEKQKKYVESLENALSDRAASSGPAQPVPGNNPIPAGLSHRESEILRLLSDGLTNKEISRVFSISPHTVKSHVIHIFNKLGVNDRTQAAVWAARLNLI